MNKQVKTTDIQKVKLDFEKFDKVLKEQKVSRRDLASRMGHNPTYFADLKKRDAAIPVGVEGFICSELGVEPGTFARKEQTEQKTGGSLAELAILENIYREICEERKLLEEVAERAEAVWNKLNTHTIQLMKIREKVYEIGESGYDKAIRFLKGTLGDKDVLESQILSKSDELGIVREDLFKAKRDLGICSAPSGHGKSTKVWWQMPK